MTPVQLDRQEKEAFLDWRRGLADLSDKEGFLLTPFERNIEVWRQLWRVLERSHLIVQIVDARNPLRFRCEDLESYITDIEGSEGEKGTGKGKRRSLLLINKADLLTRTQRITWADYFDANGVRFAFYSAANASALQELEVQTKEDTDSQDTPPDSPAAESDEESQNDKDSSGTRESEEEESDPRIRVLTVRELEELFAKSAPPLTGMYPLAS
jgi:large subunit GTPase 1